MTEHWSGEIRQRNGQKTIYWGPYQQPRYTVGSLICFPGAFQLSWLYTRLELRRAGLTDSALQEPSYICFIFQMLTVQPDYVVPRCWDGSHPICPTGLSQHFLPCWTSPGSFLFFRWCVKCIAKYPSAEGIVKCLAVMVDLQIIRQRW